MKHPGPTGTGSPLYGTPGGSSNRNIDRMSIKKQLPPLAQPTRTEDRSQAPLPPRAATAAVPSHVLIEPLSPLLVQTESGRNLHTLCRDMRAPGHHSAVFLINIASVLPSLDVATGDCGEPRGHLCLALRHSCEREAPGAASGEAGTSTGLPCARPLSATQSTVRTWTHLTSSRTQGHHLSSASQDGPKTPPGPGARYPLDTQKARRSSALKGGTGRGWSSPTASL